MSTLRLLFSAQENNNLMLLKIIHLAFSNNHLLGDRHDFTEILLKVALNTITLTPLSVFYFLIPIFFLFTFRSITRSLVNGVKDSLVTCITGQLLLDKIYLYE